MSDWYRDGPSCMRRGPWLITKSFVQGVPRYTLTNDRRSYRWGTVTTIRVLGVYDSADDAKRDAR